MIDFLRRGSAMGKKRFKPRWSEILPTYRQVMLETHDQRAAVMAAFAAVNYTAMELAWESWVKSSRFKEPRNG